MPASCGAAGDQRFDVVTLHLLGGIVPVHQLVQERVDELAAIVLVIQVVGVLPDIAGHQRRLPVNDRYDRVGGADDAQRAAVVDEPSPAATALCARDVRELLDWMNTVSGKGVSVLVCHGGR